MDGQLIFNDSGKIDDELDYMIEKSIMMYQEFEPKEGYYLADSGGKDSTVIRELAIMAGVKFDAHYAITTVDPPELLKFIKEYHPDTIREKPNINMWDLIPLKRMPPTRIARYCCQELKEEGGNGRFVVTGVRKAESSARSKRKGIEFDVYGSQSKSAIKNREIFLMSDNSEKRRMIENCVIKGKHILNPIIDWKDHHIWQFIHRYNIPYCRLYDEGFKRLGCIGCPMQGSKKMIIGFKRWPTYYRKYLKSFKEMLAQREIAGLDNKWKDEYEVMAWWLSIEIEEVIKLVR